MNSEIKRLINMAMVLAQPGTYLLEFVRDENGIIEWFERLPVVA